MMLPRSLLPFVLVVVIAVHLICFSQVKAMRKELPSAARRAQAVAVDPTLLRIVSGSFKGLLADFLLLKASVFLGGADETTPEDWDAVYTLFKQSLYLDPYFFQTGYYIQGLLAWRKGMHHKAVDLLAHHAAQRFWDWEPMFYLGFNYFYYLKDSRKAALYMAEAARRPDAPSIAANLAARLGHRSGQTLTAIALLKAMYDRTDDEEHKAAYAKRIQAHVGAYQIEQALERYQGLYGKRPQALDELVEQGVLPELPHNPFGERYFYDSETGKVFFDKIR